MKPCAVAQDTAREVFLPRLWNSVSTYKHSHPSFDIWLPSGGGITGLFWTVWKLFGTEPRLSAPPVQRRMLSHPRPDVSTGTAHRWPQFKRPRSRPCGSGGSLPASSRPVALTLSCFTSVVWPARVWAVSRAVTRHRHSFQKPVDAERQWKYRALLLLAD